MGRFVKSGGVVFDEETSMEWIFDEETLSWHEALDWEVEAPGWRVPKREEAEKLRYMQPDLLPARKIWVKDGVTSRESCAWSYDVVSDQFSVELKRNDKRVCGALVRDCPKNPGLWGIMYYM